MMPMKKNIITYDVDVQYACNGASVEFWHIE